MENFVIKGPKVPIKVEKSLGEDFWDTAEKYGERIFQIDAYSDETETFKEAKDKAVRVAIDLKQSGVNPKDVVMVCCENNFDDITPTLASLFIGAYPAPLAPTLDILGAKNIFSNIEPKVLFVSDKKFHLLKEALDALKLHPDIYIIGSNILPYKSMNEIAKNPIKEEDNFQPKKVDVHDTALILFSSGTTSTPKGICVPHLSIMASRSNNDTEPMVRDTPMIQFAPMCYISSAWGLSANIILACPRIVGPNIGVETFLKLVDKYKLFGAFLSYNTAIATATLDPDILHKYDLSSLKYVSTGGSFVHPKFIARLRKLFPKAFVVSIYGSTELGTAPFSWSDASVTQFIKTKLDSVGAVNTNCEVKVVDVHTGEALGPNQKGEILVKSPYRMNGYYNQIKQPFDEEGFLHTGDLGRYDEQGCFYILDRLTRSFKYLGNFVYPALVEKRLTEHPLVKEASVIVLPHDVDGYRALACVVLNEDSVVTEEELGDFIVKKMEYYNRPAAGFKFLKELPVNGNGKIDLKKLRDMYKN